MAPATKSAATSTSAAKKSTAKKSGAAKATTKTTAKTPAKTAGRKSSSVGLTAEERAAMKEYAAERKRASGGGDKKAAERQALFDKIAELAPDERALAERLHAIVTEVAPDLDPRTWYGMPAYARDGKVVFFLQPASKFGARYATLGFNDAARLDDGAMWPTAYALTEPTEKDFDRIAELITRAVG